MSTIDPAPLSALRRVVAISDFRDGWPPAHDPEPSVGEAEVAWRSGRYAPPPQTSNSPREHAAVLGGYLERLPLACVRHGLVDSAEIWHHWRPPDPGPFVAETPFLSRRAFRLGGETPPFASNSMQGFVHAFGAPQILCVWGLGVDTGLLDLCARSFTIYNSIDAPALRIPDEVAARFDLILTGADWQSREVLARVPGAICEIMPIGPEFADPDTFRPLGLPKPYDVVYAAAAQPYKRHDLLFDALERAARPLRALCVFGYGEGAHDLRRQATERRLAVDFVGPPGVPFTEVNRLMNLARVGVVCGVHDGAPAILTEYMLAGLPVLANSRLTCGLQFITPETGRVADEDDFAEGLVELVDAAERLRPREIVLSRWTWPHTVERLAAAIRRSPKAAALGL